MENSRVFDSIGGQAAVERLVDALYDRFEADDVIRPLFGRTLLNERTKQKRFYAEWLGGPARYSEFIWAGLYQRHEDLPITQAAAERWLRHFRAALSEAVPDDADADTIFEQAQAVALALVNHEQGATAQSAGRSAGVSKHRSEQVASCGVGARTLKRATLLARRGELDELAVLVSETSDLIDRAAFAAMLLQSATRAGRIEIVDWLINRGVDVNKPWPLGVSVVGVGLEGVLFVTPLCAARMTRRVDVVTHLLHRGAREDIFTAAFLGDLPLMRQQLAARPSLAQVADPATDVLTITPIHHAVAGDQLATLRLLLDQTKEPVLTGSRALRAAAQRGHLDMVELLLENGADASAVGAGRWVLDAEIASRLAASGASAAVGFDGQESGDWVKASCTGNQGRKDDPAYVAALLRCGARVDQPYNGASPLHYAVKAGFVKTVQLLLEHGADRESLDDRGRTPRDWLDQAATSVDKDAVRHVLEAGPRPTDLR
jgi:truncated hemoglobin YjbI/ankyrin repeat protein